MTFNLINIIRKYTTDMKIASAFNTKNVTAGWQQKGQLF